MHHFVKLLLSLFFFLVVLPFVVNKDEYIYKQHIWHWYWYSISSHMLALLHPISLLSFPFFISPLSTGVNASTTLGNILHKLLQTVWGNPAYKLFLCFDNVGVSSGRESEV